MKYRGIELSTKDSLLVVIVCSLIVIETVMFVSTERSVFVALACFKLGLLLGSLSQANFDSKSKNGEG